MGGRRGGSAAPLAGVAAAVVLAAGASVAAGGSPAGVGSLRNDVSVLDARTHDALLGLYALDTRLHETEARLVSLQVDAARLRGEATVLAQQLSATRTTLRTSQRTLASRLRALYEQGNVDPVAVMLGATSLDQAMTRLDDLSRVADQSRRIVHVTSAARGRLDRLRRALAGRRARLRTAIASAAHAADELASARAQRMSFVAGLRSAKRLKAQQIASLEAAARLAQQKAALLQAASRPVPAPPAAGGSGQPPPLAAARTLTVVATGYSLSGRTSTGVPTSWGVVAVDPAVIPLGTRLSIPGYGSGVAADTGVSGDAIDLWFPTAAQAHAWGRRTVTITLH